jgi:hypothetical protein
MSALSRLPSKALPRISSERPSGVDVSAVSKRLTPASKQMSMRRRASATSVSPGFEKFVAATKGAGAETERGYFEAGASEESVFHGLLDARADSPA